MDAKAGFTLQKSKTVKDKEAPSEMLKQFEQKQNGLFTLS